MSFNLRRIVVALIWCAGNACAQDFPARPIRVIVGPGPDIVARIMGQKFTEAWGQQVVIDPRPAAGGAIAAEAVAKAAPDGYTLLLSSASYPINAALQIGTTDVIKDFSAVALAASAPFILMVHPSMPVKSMAELIALAKARPGQINYASSGNGTPPHLAAEMFKSAAGINIVHVPYKGAGQAMMDLVGGQVQMAFAIVSAALPQVQAGKVRALGVTSPQPSPLAPDLPTLSRTGPARVRRQGLERVCRAGRDTARHRNENQRGSNARVETARDRAAAEKRGLRRGGREHARAIRRFHQGRAREVDEGRQGIRRESRLGTLRQ